MWVDERVPDADPDEPGNQPLTYVLAVNNGYGTLEGLEVPDDAKNAFAIGVTCHTSRRRGCPDRSQQALGYHAW